MEPELEVIGRHALFFDDDASAAFVNSKEALVEWNSLSIDRYDVRHLLTNPPASFRKLNISSSPPPDSHLQSQLDLERYADLPSSSDDPEAESETEAKNAAAAAFHAVPFSYGNSGDSSEQKYSDLTAGTSVFHPPFPVPESLLQNLMLGAGSASCDLRLPFRGPCSLLISCQMGRAEKLHQIIARTAMFVSKHGGQSEIVLRVKQGDNPTFGFLMPHHHLHPYFRYLVDHPELLKADNDGKSLDEKNHDKQNSEALSLLGSVYGSGEDEDGAAEVPRESEQIDSGELSAAGEMPKAHQSEQTTTLAQKDEMISKHPQSSKVKATVLSTNRITSIKPAIASAVKKDRDVRGSTSPDIDKSKGSGLFPKTKAETSIVDPPSEVKRLVDRIVEIILKNGKDFEAVLLEQDKKHGKFPFLLPSNQYHPYYLKVLKKAQESRLSGKSYSSEKDGSSWLEMDRRSASVKEIDSPASASVAPNELPLEYDDNDRKEKFKMVIGKSKKDSQDHPPRDTQQQPAVRVDAAAAAAILQAATRGIRNPNLDIFSKTSLNGINQASSNEGGQASSLSLQSSQPQNSAHKQNRNEKSSVTVPVAKEIAKTAALAAAGEADSSEAGLTREQKLKAERLRRAKMFAAMIKSGVTPLGKEQPPPRGLSVDPPGSGFSGSATNLVSAEPKEREGSSVLQAEGGISDKIGKSKRNSDDDENEYKSRKRRHYRSRKHDDSDEEEDEERKREKDDDDEEKEEEERRPSRKKHRSHRSSSSRHHRDRSKDRHRHRRKHSSKSKDTRHRHKHGGSSSSEEEDDYGHRHHHQHQHKHHESSSSEDERRHHKRRHRDEGSSEDEHKQHKRRHKGSRKDKERHERKSSRKEEKSHSEEVELEEGEIRAAKSSDQSPSTTAGDRAYREASVEGSKSSNRETRTPSLPPHETTDVPDDLRAKIRAMLLATM